jgi:hypothetical protein
MTTIRDDLLASLEFTRQKFEAYAYPSPTMRAERIADINRARAWVLANVPKEDPA